MSDLISRQAAICYEHGNEYWNLRGFTDRKNYWLRNVVSASLFAYGVHQQSEAKAATRAEFETHNFNAKEN